MGFLKCGYFIVMFFIMTLLTTFSLIILDFLYKVVGKTIPAKVAHGFGLFWGRAIMSLTPGWGVRINGRENLPTDDLAYVIVANHESATDIFTIYLLGIHFVWLSKVEIFRVPFLGRCMKICRYVPVKRGDKDSHKEALQLCAERLRQRIPVLFFPEGTRSLDGKPKPFKIGAFKLALDEKVPVLPVVLSGAGRLLKKGGVCPSDAVLHIQVLPLVYAHENEGVEAYTERVQNIIVREHEKLEHK
ncbi:MAG: 1-acyl-sn-glycerol-3-phosphate acyltransferase [Deltaproteobacteria bacterium]|nr:1-acyl-sn-glycerol-3-phosphate acyltransferase [Deltaproteobacteria bacterium]